MSNLLRTAILRRIANNPNLLKIGAIRALSAAPAPKPNPHGWTSWKDIPDSALPPPPDPTNGIYEHPRYKRVQKKRIWYQMNPHIPIYFRDGIGDRIKVYTYFASVFALLAYDYYIIVTQVAV